MFTKRVISSIRHACKPLSILTKISTTEAVLPYRLQTLLFVNPTNTRFCSTVRGKSFTETENNYVYQVLNGIPGVDNALLGNEQKIIDEAMFTSYLNKDWRNSTATDILQAFKTVKPFCQQQDITFNDPRFDSLVNGLMDHCEKLTDKELLELLRCVSEYPACSAFSSHNYHDIWSCLDDICCWKMGTWDIDTMFACADLWFKLKLGKVSDFIFELLDRLTRKADMLTKDQLVRLFFYFNICRKRPVDFEYEHALQNKIHEMNVDEMAVVALGFFKSQSRIKLLPILEAMVKKLTSTAMGVHEISLTAIMKVLRLSYATKILPQINTMLDSLCPELDRLSDVACLHVALLSTGLQTFHGDILSKCSQKLVENLPNTRLKELERILNVLTMFAFDPQTKPDIFKAAYRELHRDSRKQEIDQFPRCLASALHYLSLRGIYAHTLLDKVLDNEFITNNFGKHAKLLPQQLFFLDASVDIECPDYKGNRLLPPLKYKAAKWQTQWPPSYDQYKKITPKDQLFLDTVDAVKNIVGGSDLLRVEHVLPHFPMADIIVCKDTKTDTYSKPLGFEKYILGDIMKPFNDGTLKWYAIVVLTWNSTMRENGSAPLGHASMKLRQLEKIGYTPVTVMWNQFMKLSPNEKEQYIRRKLA